MSDTRLETIVDPVAAALAARRSTTNPRAEEERKPWPAPGSGLSTTWGFPLSRSSPNSASPWTRFAIIGWTMSRIRRLEAYRHLGGGQGRHPRHPPAHRLEHSHGDSPLRNPAPVASRPCRAQPSRNVSGSAITASGSPRSTPTRSASTPSRIARTPTAELRPSQRRGSLHAITGFPCSKLALWFSLDGSRRWPPHPHRRLEPRISSGIQLLQPKTPHIGQLFSQKPIVPLRVVFQAIGKVEVYVEAV